MATEVMTQLGLIFAVSVVFMIFALRFRLPSVIGLLLAGAIMGPNVLKLVPHSEYINIFSEMGAILLLFFVGIEFSVSKIAQIGLRSLIVWFIKGAFVFIITYEASLLMGLNEFTSLVLASAFVISSTTFFIKIIVEKKISGSAEANLVFVVQIIDDLLAVFMLAIYSGLATNGGGEGTSVILFSIFKAIFVLTVAYLVLQKGVQPLFEKLIQYKSDEITLFLSLSLAILMSFFASSIGLASSIGAFLAGNMLSTVKGFEKTRDVLSKFGMLFSAFFFLSIGMLINPQSLLENAVIITVLFVILNCGIFASVFTSSYLVGYTSNSAVHAGLLTLTVGEFSLLIATQTKNLPALHGFDIISVASALVFLTALSGSVLIKYDKKIDAVLGVIIPKGLKDSGKRVSIYFNSVFTEFEPHGSVFNTFTKESRQIIINIIFIALIALSIALIYNLMQNISPVYSQYSNFVILFAILILLPFFVRIVFSVKELIGSVAHAFHKALGENLTLDDLAMRESAIVLFMFGIAFATPLMVTLLKLPKQFSVFFIVPLFLSLLFIWNLATIIKKMMTKKDQYHCPRIMTGFSRTLKKKNNSA